MSIIDVRIIISAIFVFLAYIKYLVVGISVSRDNTPKKKGLFGLAKFLMIGIFEIIYAMVIIPLPNSQAFQSVRAELLNIGVRVFGVLVMESPLIVSCISLIKRAKSLDAEK